MKPWPFLLILLIGCAHKHEVTRHLNGDSALAGNVFDLPKTLYQQQLAASMAQRNEVILGPIGIGGVMTPEYISYKRLMAIAPDSFWVKLSYSKRPVERMYAFEALAHKKSPWLSFVAMRLQTDTAIVECLTGCEGTKESISYRIQSQPK